MRLEEIISAEEWQQLQRVIFDSTWRALSMYQQQRAIQQRIASNPAATLKPQAAKKAKALASKVKRPPHAAPPKPLPKPSTSPKIKAANNSSYSPVKTAKPLQPTTRMATAKLMPNAMQQAPKPTTPNTVLNIGDIDQATRQWLPKNKQGMNPIDLLSLDERG